MRAKMMRVLAALATAAILELPFPLAGPMGPWRGVFAWFGLVPLIVAVLSLVPLGVETTVKKPLLTAYELGWLAGIVWYAGNCYWIYDTMLIHGHLSSFVSVLLLLGFSLVLGNYFALFTFGLLLIQKASGSRLIALAAAPFLWVGLDLLASRFTSVPWDQLGYSQVDNALMTQLAPWTGTYGITFVLVAANALLAMAFLPLGKTRRFALGGVALMLLALVGLYVKPAAPQATETAVLMQPNLSVSDDNIWNAQEWQRQFALMTARATEPCKSADAIAGIPELTEARVAGPCDAAKRPALIAWPESPAPFYESDKRFADAMKSLASASHVPSVMGGVGLDFVPEAQGYNFYNSGIVFSPTGEKIGRYDKIHLVPYGEFIPYQELFSFAHKLTGRVSSVSRGEERKVFRLNGHSYGVFICYESVFADEVRHFAELGGEVFVNISDDGWYGDTSAPWQHLNMARMRAIENRRWILRATNDGVTAAIDPNGTVRQSIARHEYGALLAGFGYDSEQTFYTKHGDVFAWVCAILSIGLFGWSVRRAFATFKAAADRKQTSGSKSGSR